MISPATARSISIREPGRSMQVTTRMSGALFFIRRPAAQIRNRIANSGFSVASPRYFKRYDFSCFRNSRQPAGVSPS